MNYIERRIADRDALLGILVCGDRYAAAALARDDDMALLRRITKAGLADALFLAVQRALLRGHGDYLVRKALGLTVDEYRPIVATIYSARQTAPRP